jgi:hypothetical protein
MNLSSGTQPLQLDSIERLFCRHNIARATDG